MIKSQFGFTLIELIVVIALMAVMSSVAIPMGLKVWQHRRLDSVSHRLWGTIRFTRHMAIELQHDVALCAKSNSVASPLSWSHGWVVNDLIALQPLRVYSSVPKATDIKWRGGFSSHECLSFNAYGFTHGQQGRFILSIDNSPQTQQLVVSRAGRVRRA